MNARYVCHIFAVRAERCLQVSKTLSQLMPVPCRAVSGMSWPILRAGMVWYQGSVCGSWPLAVDLNSTAQCYTPTGTSVRAMQHGKGLMPQQCGRSWMNWSRLLHAGPASVQRDVLACNMTYCHVECGGM